MVKITVIAHNIRSTFNIGSIFRTADGLGVEEIILSGYSPYPSHPEDTRLPHISSKLTNQIHKTALGAESIVPFRVTKTPPIDELREAGYRIVALEQSAHSTPLHLYKTPSKIALLIGEEVTGIDPNLLQLSDDIIEIPMLGKKESFNVSVATAIALYQLSVLSYNTP